MPAVTVTAARGANRCGDAGSGLGCCVVAQVRLGTGRQRNRDGGTCGNGHWCGSGGGNVGCGNLGLGCGSRTAESGCAGLGTGKGSQKAGEGRR